MKKAGTILLAAMMSVTITATFAACGGGGGNGDTATTKTVKVWLHKSQTEDEGKTYKALEELFNEADYKTKDGRDIVMRIEYKSNAESLQNAINAENAMGGAGLPDVFAVDSPYVAVYAKNGFIVPIDEYISQEVKGDYVDSVIEQSTYDGKLYALSGADAPGGLYYNKELLKAVGYTDDQFGTPEKPWSWKDLMTAMQKLKDAKKPYQIMLNLGFGGNEGQMYLHSPLVYSAGGDFADANGKLTGTLTSEKSLAGLDMFTQFFESNAKNEWLYNGTNENAFPGEQIAFEIYGPWLVRTINKDYKSFADKYDIMPYPVYEDANGTKGTIATPCGSWGFAVSKAARDKDAAAQVVAYLTGAEASGLLYDSIGVFPTHKSYLAEEEAFNSGALKSLATLLTDTAKARPKLTNYNELRDAYSRIISYIQTNAGKSNYNLSAYVAQEADGVDR